MLSLYCRLNKIELYYLKAIIQRKHAVVTKSRSVSVWSVQYADDIRVR